MTVPSVAFPVSSKILIKQHLNAHYKNIQSVKACIDNTTPYSFFHNPTTKGYQKSFKVSHKTPLSTKPETNNFRNLTTVKTFSDDPEVDQIVRRFVLDDNEKQVELLTFGEHHSEIADDNKVHHKHDCSYGEPVVIRKLDLDCFSTKTIQQKESLSKDVLDVHRNKFTNPKPFSPRTIKSNASSKLISLRCYNPPKRIVRLRQSDSEVAVDIKPVLHSKKSAEACATNSDFEEKSSIKHKGSTTNREEIFSLLSRKVSNFSKHSISTPRHQRRISSKHQPNESIADGSQNFGKVNQWLNTLPCKSTDHKPRIVTSNQYDAEKLEKSIVETEFFKDNTDKQMMVKPMVKDTSIENLKNEISYLNFISSVTNDVLTRGVLTDINVNTILLEHATINEYGLSKDQINKAIQHIRTQLNIKSEATTTTTDINYLLNPNSSGLLFHNNEVVYDIGNNNSHVQQQQQQLQPAISYKTILDIKPSCITTTSSPSAVPYSESHKSTNHSLTTSTLIAIRPNQSTYIPKDAQQIFQNLMNDSYQVGGTDISSRQYGDKLLKDKCLLNEYQNVHMKNSVDDKQNLQSVRYNTTDKLIELCRKQRCEDEITEDNKHYEKTLNDKFDALNVSNTTITNTTIATDPSSVNTSKSLNIMNVLQTKPDEVSDKLQNQYYTESNQNQLTIEHAIDDDGEDDEKHDTRHSRVQFASEAEFFSPSYYSEQATSVSSFTDLCNLSNTIAITTSTTNTITTSSSSSITPTNNDFTVSGLHSSPETSNTFTKMSFLQISNSNKHVNNNNNPEMYTVGSDIETKPEKSEEQEISYKDDFLSDYEDSVVKTNKPIDK
ncbi:spermatogenesis-associated 7-like [Schistosoma japonicum]|nr:spermatogenesis-associated 7-like [Schistosoma japonicum]